MPDEPDNTDFDKSKAELFDALGHPIRIRILHVLEDGPLGFSELRRRVGLESSGHLQFHLSKLGGLVRSGSDGAYFLTDDGKEALAFVKMVKVAATKDTTDTKVHKTLRNTCIAVGILCIVADVATLPPATVGTTYCGSSGAAFCPLFPYSLPILAIIGVVVGLASITMAFASERGASVISSISAGFALTFISAIGSWTFSHMDVGWPFAWAHQFYSFGPLQSQPWFSIDVLGLSVDIAFWAAVVFAVMNLIRVLLPRQSG